MHNVNGLRQIEYFLKKWNPKLHYKVGAQAIPGGPTRQNNDKARVPRCLRRVLGSDTSCEELGAASCIDCVPTASNGEDENKPHARCRRDHHTPYKSARMAAQFQELSDSAFASPPAKTLIPWQCMQRTSEIHLQWKVE